MSLFFYNCFLFLYKLGAQLISPWNEKAKLWVEGRKGIFGQLKQSLDGSKQPLIWMHCASLGEFEQGRPVLEELHKKYPAYKTLITFFSPSGYKIVKNYKGADIVCYLPMDSGANARLFLDIVQPDLVLWVKYEYWYYYLQAIKKRSIPLLLISGNFREDQPFFKWYGGMHRKMLAFFTHLFVQTPESAKKLGTIGFSPDVTISGDTRFDRVTDIVAGFEHPPVFKEFCKDHPVIVAGSTWPEDEEELSHYANTHPEIKMLVVPHEISEDHLKDIEKMFKNNIRFRILEAELPLNDAGNKASTLIVDTIGLLSRIYHYADITYVGGGFGDNGLHNILEAAVHGKPVIFGPNYDSFYEAVEMIDAGGAFSVESALELEKLLDKLFNNPEILSKAGQSARNYVYARRGATEIILKYIQEKRLLTS